MAITPLDIQKMTFAQRLRGLDATEVGEFLRLVVDELQAKLDDWYRKNGTPTDMAAYKAEFLAHYYEGRRRPLRSYAFGLINHWGALAEHVPWLANLFTQVPPFRSIVSWALGLAPKRRQGLWANRDIEPSGIDRMVVEGLHRTNMGVDHDYRNLINHAFRVSLANGWGGSRIASMVSDILFGIPTPVLFALAIALLAYLAVTRQPHSRDALAALLWLAILGMILTRSDSPPAKA